MQKCFYIPAIIILFMALPAFAGNSANLNLGPNLVYNGGFEKGNYSWDIPKNSAKVVEDIAHNGAHSLYYSNTNPKRYKLFAQRVNVKPGQKIFFSAWIKGKNVRSENGSGEGASLYMQSYGKNKYLGGSFPGQFTGSFDWIKVTGRYTVPPEAKHTSVGLYLRRGVTGKVWFDDVQVRIMYPPAIESTLRYPNYRGMVLKNDNRPWEFHLHINEKENWGNVLIEVITTLHNKQGKRLLKNNAQIKSNKQSAQIKINPPKNLPAGKYTLKQTTIDHKGRQIETSENTIQVVREMPEVYVDRLGFTVVEGKRFFPFGFYIGAGTSNVKNLKRIAKGGFNTVLSYSYGVGSHPKAYMENAEKYGLKVIYALKNMYPGKHGYGKEAFNVARKYIKMIQGEPALLAWYTNDELDDSWVPKMTKMYNIIKEMDPNHPTFQVQYRLSSLKVDAAITDILGGDPYPVGSADLSLTSRRTKAVIDAVSQGAKGIWMVAQSMDLAVYNKEDKQHPPSLDEMRNQAYQMLINGAKGLIFYSYYDMMFEDYPRNKSTKNMELFHRRWNDCEKMAKEINQVIPVILKNNKVALNVPSSSYVQAAAWKDGNQLWILLANPYYKKESITFAFPEGWEIKNTRQGQIKSNLSNGKVTFTLPKIGSGVFKLVKMKNYPK